MAKYKWDNPTEWLLEKMADWDNEECRHALERLIERMDFDTIQDLFQDEMDEDGYFEEEPEEWRPGSSSWPA